YVGVLLDGELDAHVFGGDVLDVEQQRHLARQRDLGDALDQARLVQRVRHAGDVYQLARAALFAFFVRRAQPNAALPRLIDGFDLFRSRNDFAARRKIWAFDGATQLAVAEVLLLDQSVEQTDRRRAHLFGVVRWDVGSHADGYAARAVDEEYGQTRWQNHGLFASTVVVRPKVNGILADFLEDVRRDRRQPKLGVAHRRWRVAVE